MYPRHTSIPQHAHTTLYGNKICVRFTVEPTFTEAMSEILAHLRLRLDSDGRGRKSGRRWLRSTRVWLRRRQVIVVGCGMDVLARISTTALPFKKISANGPYKKIVLSYKQWVCIDKLTYVGIWWIGASNALCWPSSVIGGCDLPQAEPGGRDKEGIYGGEEDTKALVNGKFIRLHTKRKDDQLKVHTVPSMICSILIGWRTKCFLLQGEWPGNKADGHRMILLSNGGRNTSAEPVSDSE